MKFKLILLFLLIIFLNKSALSNPNNKSRDSNTDKNINNLIDNKNFNNIKIHVVKEGDTLTSIAKMYSIDKELIIKANKLSNENYIFIGQNLKITDTLSGLEIRNQIKKNFHKIKAGENLTEIANQYQLTLKELIEINKIENPETINIGKILKLKENISIETDILANKQNDIDAISQQETNRSYGPLIINSEKYLSKKRIILLEASHKNGREFILSIKCDKRKINVRGKGRKWKGWMPAKTKFEKELLNDFC